MKLRNRKTGEIGNLNPYGEDGRIWVWIGNISKPEYRYNSLAELNEEWEDVPEEPKIYWSVDSDGMIISEKDRDDIYDRGSKQIGNFFETEEEAEKAVEKLKAWKRLKDKGFKVDLWDYDGGNYQERIKTGRILFRVKDYEENDKDLDLLFSQEDD